MMETMDTNSKLQLIEFVREHKCLYDANNKDYKNVYLKDKLWSSIAKELNESSASLKRKWKSLRDGHNKYKRIAKTADGKKMKYMWDTHLSFLDSIAENKSSLCDIQESVKYFSESPQFMESLMSSPQPMVEIPEKVISDSLKKLANEEELKRKKMLKKKRLIDDLDQFEILDETYNSDTSHHVLDSVDYLFLSYAQTFKKFSLKRQAILKVDMASLFSEAELCEISMNEANSKKSNKLDSDKVVISDDFEVVGDD